MKKRIELLTFFLIFAINAADSNLAQKLTVLSHSLRQLTKYLPSKKSPQINEFITKVKQVINLEPDLPILSKTFDKKHKGFGPIASKSITLNYTHWFAPDFKITREGALEFSGFHHDLNNVLEKSKLINIAKKPANKNGIYSADIQWNAKLIRKTFFPAHWTRTMVVKKILEAYDNFIARGAKNYIKKGSRFTVDGYTQEGIKIRMHIHENGTLESAYPILT